MSIPRVVVVALLLTLGVGCKASTAFVQRVEDFELRACECDDATCVRVLVLEHEELQRDVLDLRFDEAGKDRLVESVERANGCLVAAHRRTVAAPPSD